MSAASRLRMLTAVRGNQPLKVPMPPVPDFPGDDSVTKFTAVLTAIGGQVVQLDDLSQLGDLVATRYPADYRIASTLLPGRVAVTALTPVAELAPIDLAVLRGELGVAENGSVWLSEAAMLHRALPTITQHLVLVLDPRRLVATMHQAYAQLAIEGVGGYGTFLAGPSKTADIEQSLVIGAHGARSLTVVLVAPPQLLAAAAK